MNVNLNANASLVATAQSEAGISMLKKAIDQQGQGVLELLNALPQVQQPNNPPNLGQNIDVMA